MVTIFRLHVNELSPEILDSIRAAYRNKTVEISVTDAEDETAFLLANEANRKHLFNSIKEIEEGKVVELTVEELIQKYGLKDENHHA